MSNISVSAPGIGAKITPVSATADIESKQKRRPRPKGRLADGTVPDALKHFEDLPDDAFVRQPVVEALFGISPSTVWRWVKSGNLPAPKNLSSRVAAWRVGGIRQKLRGEA